MRKGSSRRRRRRMKRPGVPKCCKKRAAIFFRFCSFFATALRPLTYRNMIVRLGPQPLPRRTRAPLGRSKPALARSAQC
ncbi:hypothetical protein LY76DRAFT_292323 [Colletotrichum caudatum]|nr:hypothetical protein LY76DRAFT_292323 [Colletotrichum caudatum]